MWYLYTSRNLQGLPTYLPTSPPAAPAARDARLTFPRRAATRYLHRMSIHMQYVANNPTIDSTPVDRKRPPCGATTKKKEKKRKEEESGAGRGGAGGRARNVHAHDNYQECQ